MTHVGGCWRVSHLSGGDSVYLCDDTVIIGSCLIAPIMLTLTCTPVRVLFTSTSHFELKCAFKVLLEKCQCLSLTYSLVINCSNSERKLERQETLINFYDQDCKRVFGIYYRDFYKDYFWQVLPSPYIWWIIFVLNDQHFILSSKCVKIRRYKTPGIKKH